MSKLSQFISRLRDRSWRRASPNCPVTSTSDLAGWFRELHGNRVLSGPFLGLRYGDFSFGSTHLPKLLGTYERELAGLFTAANLGQYGAFINFGCAEGYYTNGIAHALKEHLGRSDFQVIGIDLNEQALEESRRISRLNGLTVAVAPAFDFSSGTRGVGKTLIICDVEGAEIDLMRPERFAAMDRTDFIIEVHDVPRTAAILDELQQRFSATHERSVILSLPREARDFPREFLLPVSDAVKMEAMDERRVNGLRWLNLRSKPK